MDAQSVPILLAEDHSSDVAIIQRCLAKGNISNPLHVARDGQDALDRLRDPAVRYAVVILDIHMPKRTGIEVLAEARRIDPDMVAIMLTANASLQTAVQALRHDGAFDYLQKSKDDRPQLVEAVKLALKQWALRRQTRWVVPCKTGTPRVIDMSEVKTRFDLSDREIDVVKCLCRGDTNKEIGAHLFISELTVKGHLKHIYGKIGVHTRSSVVSTILAGFPTLTDQPTTSNS